MSLALVQHLHLPEHPAADMAQLLLNDLQCREGHGAWRSCPDATCEESANPTGHLDRCESAALGLELARSQTAVLARSGYPVAQDSSGEESGSGQLSTLTKSPLY